MPLCAPGEGEPGGDPSTPDPEEQLTELVEGVLEGEGGVPPTGVEELDAVITQVSDALTEIIGDLPVAPPVDPAPVQQAVVDVVTQPTALPTAAASSLAAAVSNAVASEVASVQASPAAYPTARACEVTTGRPPFCSPTPAPTPTAPVPDASAVQSSAVAVVTSLPSVVPSSAFPTFCAGILKPVCKP